MESKVNYTAVGLFVLLLGAALVAMIWWLATRGNQTETTTYLIYATDSVNGLRADSNVLYRGVAVGKVDSIKIDPDNPALIRIRVSIDRNVPVRADTVAQLSPLGVTGLSAINLSGGESQQPLKPPPGSDIAVIPYKPSLFSQIEGGLSSATLTLNRLGDHVDNLLSPANLQAVTDILRNLQTLMQTLASNQQRIDQMFANADLTSARLAATAGGADKLVAQTRQLVQRIDGLTQQLGAVVPQFGRAASQVQSAAGAVTAFSQAGTDAMGDLRQRTLPQIDALARSLQQLSDQLGELTQRLSANPSQLLYGPSLPPPGPGEAR